MSLYQDPFTRDLGPRLLDEGQFTDLKITCKSYTFKVHRNVVFAQSEWFQKACSNGIQESHEQVISLPTDYPAVTARLLTFFYTGILVDLQDTPTYCIPCPTRISRRVLSSWISQEDSENTGSKKLTLINGEECGLNPLTLFARVFLAADKFLVEKAMAPALMKIVETLDALEEYSESVAFQALAQAAAVVYNDAGDSVCFRKLKNVVVWELQRRQSAALTHRQTIVELYSQQPELGADLTMTCQAQHTFWCGKCSEMVRLPGNGTCVCGLTGQCHLKYCRKSNAYDFDIESVVCWECKKAGGLSQIYSEKLANPRRTKINAIDIGDRQR